MKLNKLDPLRSVVVLSIILSIFCPWSVFAEVETIIATHKYVMGDNDSKNDARRMCFMEAKRKVLEKAGSYIASNTTIRNYQLAKDEIIAYSAALLKIETINEKWEIDGSNMAVTLTVKADVDASILEKQLEKIQKDKSVQGKIKQQSVKLQELEETVNTLRQQLGPALSTKENNTKIPEDMVLIPAGEFEMGSSTGDFAEPVHNVYLDAYFIDKYEVTVEQYSQCYGVGKCKEPTVKEIYCNWEKPGRENNPINCVTWNDAIEYCEYHGKRLPTEAEWEKAATWRNGKKFKYPTGKDTISCFDAVMLESGEWKTNGGCGRAGTWPVGSKSEEINGTYDMAGNVSEWVADWFSLSYYEFSPRMNPKGPKPTSSSARGLRGGSWREFTSLLLGASRLSWNPSGYGASLGFRCAYSP
ncbi:MAG: SUMF1/EgtB/PvdO family nonheme iron enzyme [Deltaproteobacteria bacterium]|jgi:formylglycine-generating enzyme required for sulfatase activity|nr:SUMF1/EgtB/PvdO family nonheme iron enzyme [Deltaproteobacteria bacterium]MBT4643846.1 SUMF1/EgtB/PvdO family nonheme iron enzyme [Deltaproteobacteria bacterium]MBT6502043.1 SUMF1/EgtB/PvdO family nonheme iron enzyme [Deltaproteobacteria bacterium]MBT7892651.1 SUMF1/EgtB/PvdO family nonheme iron enzyme [Deltaproteobacteria bacterium]